MAQIHEDAIIIRLSRAVKTGSTPTPIVTDELLNTLEAVVNKLVGPSVVVDVQFDE